MAKSAAIAPYRNGRCSPRFTRHPRRRHELREETQSTRVRMQMRSSTQRRPPRRGHALEVPDDAEEDQMPDISIDDAVRGASAVLKNVGLQALTPSPLGQVLQHPGWARSDVATPSILSWRCRPKG